jgi:hypothetical protein
MATVVIIPSAGPPVAVLSGDLVLPIRGNWVAHLETGAGTSPAEGDRVAILVAGDKARRTPDATFVGTVRRSRPWAGRHELVVVGGAGGLADPIAADDHHAGPSHTVPAELILARVCRLAGEAVSASAQAALEPFGVTRWTRARGPATEALSVLADALGLGWRVLDDGTVWMGPETWPEVAPSAIGYELAELQDDGTIRTASGGATLRPGTTVLGRRVVRVRYDFRGLVEAELLTSVSGEAGETLAPAVYREIGAAEVVKQHPDGTLDLVPDGTVLPGMHRVAYRVGMPGARYEIDDGERVRLAFEGGSPTAPVALLFEPDEDGATKAVARFGDPVAIGQLSVSMVGGDPKLTWTPALGAPVGPADSVTIDGFIGGGSDEVFLR